MGKRCETSFNSILIIVFSIDASHSCVCYHHNLKIMRWKHNKYTCSQAHSFICECKYLVAMNFAKWIHIAYSWRSYIFEDSIMMLVCVFSLGLLYSTLYAYKAWIALLFQNSYGSATFIYLTLSCGWIFDPQ